jgi:hypothetical protein
MNCHPEAQLAFSHDCHPDGAGKNQDRSLRFGMTMLSSWTI